MVGRAGAGYEGDSWVLQFDIYIYIYIIEQIRVSILTFTILVLFTQLLHSRPMFLPRRS